jgi:hypothetical protein
MSCDDSFYLFDAYELIRIDLLRRLGSRYSSSVLNFSPFLVLDGHMSLSVATAVPGR